MIPKPFAIAIDDLGWMSGHNDGYLQNGPYRIGINRMMTSDDYRPIIAIAKQMNIRLQGLFILGELDRENVMSKYKTVYPSNGKWYSKKCSAQLKVMDLIKSNSAYLEFGLHGVGHEFWPDESSDFKRAEWYNLIDKEPWPESSIRDHIDCFIDIMSQYDISSNSGHSFPKSFVPCAYSYYWNPKPKNCEYSLGSIFSEYGAQFSNTNFSKIPELNPPVDAGMDQGLHVMNRYNFGNLWYELAKTPTIPLEFQTTEFIEAHWANFLAQDQFLQESAINKWINYFKSVKASPQRYCAKNTAEMHSQFLYKKYCQFYKSNDKWLIDNSKMPKCKHHINALQGLVLKLPLTKENTTKQFVLDNQQIPAVYSDGNYLYLYLPKLNSRIYELSMLNSEHKRECIWHDTTNNIYNLNISKERILIEGQFYGSQTLTLLTDKEIVKVKSNNADLEIKSCISDGKAWKIEVNAKDIQGVPSTISCVLN